MHPSTPYSRNIPQSFTRGTRPYTFPRSTKHMHMSLACSQDFSKICWRVRLSSIVQRKPHWVLSSFGSIIFAASWHTLFLGDCAKRCRGSWFIHSCLPFCVWGWSICQSFGALIKRNATWHTQPNHPAFWVPLIHYQLFAITFRLGFSSGFRKLIDAQFYGSFHMCKVKTFRLKNFAQFCQVKCQRWQKKQRVDFFS